MPDLISLCERDGTIRYQTPSLVRLLGWHPDQLAGASLLDLVHPEDRDLVLAALADARDGQAGQPVECRLRRQDGGWLVTETVAVDAGGDPAYEVVLTSRGVDARKRTEAALREHRSQLVHAQRIARVGNWTWDLTTDEISGSGEFYRIFGIPPDTPLTVPEILRALVHPDDLPAVQQIATRLRDDPSPYEIEVRIVRPDDAARTLLCRGEGVRDEAGRVVRATGTNQDITAAKQANEALRASEERLRGITEASLDAIVSTDAEGRLRSWNRSAERMFGWSAEEIIGQPLSLLIPEQLCEAYLARLAALQRTQGGDLSRELVEQTARRRDGTLLPVELTARRRDGTLVPVELTAGMWRSSEGLAYSTVIRDITDRKALEQQLVHRAFHDDLTGLPNRALFVDRLEEVVARRRGTDSRLAVLLLDLDDFKDLNDSLGHSAGDELLRLAAERISRGLRNDDIVARLGGDEFGLLLDGVADAAEAVGAAERVLQALREPFPLASRQIHVTATTGIALTEPADPTDAQELLRNADTAMYLAKRRGRGHCECFAASMHDELIRRLELADDLRRAVVAGEFEVRYQPIVELADGRLIGVEALVRWQHPERGPVGPVEFIPLAEETGLIVPIGYQVLREACNRAAGWRHAYPARPFTLNVNMSVRQVQDPDLVPEVTRILATTGLTPAALTLEITESVLAENLDDLAARLWELKAVGIRLAVDDFGTGYSSLSRLRDFPIDDVKIPKPFVDGILQGPADSALARAIIELAGTLDLHVVAEGIEHREQWIELRRLGCEMGQGYYFSRPVTQDRFAELLHRDRLVDPDPQVRAAAERLVPLDR